MRLYCLMFYWLGRILLRIHIINSTINLHWRLRLLALKERSVSGNLHKIVLLWPRLIFQLNIFVNSALSSKVISSISPMGKSEEYVRFLSDKV